jgi:hypothetical protein
MVVADVMVELAVIEVSDAKIPPLNRQPLANG